MKLFRMFAGFIALALILSVPAFGAVFILQSPVTQAPPPTAPTLGGGGNTVTWTQGGSATVVDASVTVSAENVENVVRPPRNPVAIARRAVSEIKAWFFVIAMKIPIRNPPIILAVKVPSGMAGKIEFMVNPSHQRSQAPKAAPIPTEKNGYIRYFLV